MVNPELKQDPQNYTGYSTGLGLRFFLNKTIKDDSGLLKCDGGINFSLMAEKNYEPVAPVN
jgi:hypothetical protein